MHMIYKTRKRKSGLCGCMNRDTKIYMTQISDEGKLQGRFHLNNGESIRLDEDNYFEGFPKFSPNYEYLVYYAVKDPF